MRKFCYRIGSRYEKLLFNVVCGFTIWRVAAEPSSIKFTDTFTFTNSYLLL